MILVIRKPRNIAIGYSALIGAAASVAIGITPLHDLVDVWDIVWNPTFTFVGIIIMSLVYDEVGLFEYSAFRLAQISKGSGRLLFVLFILLSAVVSAVFANDGAVLVMTPIVFSLLKQSSAGKTTYLAFVMAVGFVSDTASMPFTISNLVNILSAQYFSVAFLNYARVMILPDIVSVAASLLLLFLVYRRSIPPEIRAMNGVVPSQFIRDPLIFRTSVPVLGALILTYAVTGIFGIPVAFIALPASIAILLWARSRKTVDTSKILREAPWQIVLFSIGMYIIVFGLAEQGLESLVVRTLLAIWSFHGPVSVILSGYLFAFFASLMNNLPSVMLGNLSVHAASGPLLYMYANVIANDIGPKFTPIGSLATLLWIYTLNRKRGIPITSKYYMAYGFILALPVLTITLLALYFVA
ncbi:arsenical efflux pump membrane protein ArsB [Thermoplasmatales archaeon AK]|nr:arsenical efflux pump membrane protein ArsB [Thermoplasmatales archaeon AK]